MTAFLAALGAAAVVLGFVTSVLTLVSQRRIIRAATQAADLAAATAGKVQSISVSVDGRLSGLIERQAQLLGALHKADVPVPPAPPVDPPHEPAAP
jgi:hypothetical protein